MKTNESIKDTQLNDGWMRDRWIKDILIKNIIYDMQKSQAGSKM